VGAAFVVARAHVGALSSAAIRAVIRVHARADVGAVGSAHVCARGCLVVDADVGASLRVGGPAHVCASVGIVVHVSDVLSVTLGHREDFGADFDELAATLLRGPTAVLANRERNLVARPAWILGALEDLARKKVRRTRANQ